MHHRFGGYNCSRVRQFRHPILTAASEITCPATNNNDKMNKSVTNNQASTFAPVSDQAKSIQEKSFVDIPASLPAVRFPLPRVGVSNRPCYIQIKDPFTGEKTRLFGNVKILFGLPGDQRGVHMSRIEECLSAMDSQLNLSLSEWSQRLSEQLIEKQELLDCALYLDAHYEKLTTRNPSKKTSHEMIMLYTAIERNRDSFSVCAGVRVPFINACPCTQRWGMREFYNQLIEAGYDSAEAQVLMAKAPLQAHTNLGHASIKIWSEKATHAALYNLLDRAVPIVRELLKGMDEHALVKHAHQQGQFCEDNARSIVREVIAEFDGKLEDSARLEIRVEVEESVHFHNLCAEIESTFGDIQKEMIRL